ncbi:MAG: PspC domain-containing protein [Bacteroidetes bacterium]|nr:PspC domain-containing protein [Bacteroidota bacterium]
MAARRLYRNVEESKLGGVCAGLAGYFDVDVVIIRLMFVAGFFIGGGILVYLIAWIIVPAQRNSI